jgi:hypothetical protein
LQDQEWQAEIDCYNELCARADVIREKECQRLQALEPKVPSIDGQSDSELSVLASSLFNGMDGIELSQGLGNVDISGKDENGTKISPWCTRSGKIVNYRDS